MKRLTICMFLAVSLPIAADPMAAGQQALADCSRAATRNVESEANQYADVAIAEFQAAIANGDNEVEARIGMALAMMQCKIGFAGMMGQMRLSGQIEEQLIIAHKLDPENWQPRWFLAELLYNMPPFLGRGDEAIEHLKAVIDVQESGQSPAMVDPYLLLAKLYDRGEMEAEATAVRRRGLQRFPQSEQLKEALQDPLETSQVEPVGPVFERLESTVRDAVASPSVPATSVAIVIGNRPLLMSGFGFADVENEVAAGVDSVYRIGSISKQFLAASLLRLAEHRALSIHDRVVEWIDEPALGDITIRQLLSHTSGLPMNAPEGTDWLAAGLAQDRLGAPGQRYAYSNFGYGVLGLVFEKASEQPYPAFLQHEFFDPLEMTRTRVCDARELIPGRAQGYSVRGEQLLNDDPIQWTTTLYYAGGLCSSARDLSVWNRSLHGGQLLSDASYQLMTSAPELPNGEVSTYGMGLRIGRYDGRRIVHHSGGISGFLTELAYYPDHHLSLAVLTNSEAGSPRRLAYALVDVVFRNRGA